MYMAVYIPFRWLPLKAIEKENVPKTMNTSTVFMLPSLAVRSISYIPFQRLNNYFEDSQAAVGFKPPAQAF